MLKIHSEWKESNIITGATLTISLEDARAIYKLTQLDPPPEDMPSEEFTQSCRHKAELSRQILRRLSKEILITGGNTTTQEDLLDKFKFDKE